MKEFTGPLQVCCCLVKYNEAETVSRRANGNMPLDCISD